MNQPDPLFDDAAERAVLGSILIDPPALHEVADRLQPAHFHNPTNRSAYQAMRQLERGGVAIDPVTLAEALERGDGREPANGWVFHVIGLLNAVPTSVNIGSYARIVADYGRRRQMVATAQQILRLAHDKEISADDALGRATQAVLEAQQEHDNGRVLAPRDYVGRFLDDLEREESTETLPTPIVGWNRQLNGGLARPFAHFVAGRPKMGKSSLGLQCATHAALNLGKAVYLATTEMSDRQFTRRIVSQQTGIPTTQLARRNLSPEEMERAMQAAGKLSESRLYLDVSAGLKPSQVRSRCMRQAARHGLDLIIVDHIHEMQPDRPDRRHLELGEMARSLRETASALDVPIVIVAQLSRGAEHRGSKRPALPDFREAGALEEVAYSVTFVYREHYYDESADEEAAELIVAAHRDGPTGTVFARWNGPLMRFENPTRSNGSLPDPAPIRQYKEVLL